MSSENINQSLQPSTSANASQELSQNVSASIETPFDDIKVEDDEDLSNTSRETIDASPDFPPGEWLNLQEFDDIGTDDSQMMTVSNFKFIS